MNPSIELQKQIRDNAEDVRNFVSDLHRWEEEMKEREVAYCSSSSESVDLVPPVRNSSKRRDCSDCTGSIPSEGIQSAKKRISSDDYAAWEKFDVEKACVEIDFPVNTSVESEEETRVKENKLRDEANFEKEKGNQFVKKEKWDSAIECYSKAIKCYPKDAVYFCNRALCYLKKKDYRSAETDCTSALALDSTYVKALHRRGLARKELNQLCEAREDLKKAMEIEPNNTAVQRDYNVIHQKIIESGVDAAIDRNTFHSGSEIVLDLTEPILSDPVNSDPILPAKKHRLPSSQSKQVPDKQEWPKFDDAHVVEPINIPPHRRSKKPLKRILIEEVSSIKKSLVAEISPPIIKEDPVPKTKGNALSESEKDVQLPSSSASSGSMNEKKPVVTSASLLPKVLPSVPKNLVQFLAGWREVKSDHNLSFKYLKQIPGKDFAKIFQDSLDGNLLSQIIEVLASQFVKEGEPVVEHLSGLTEVKRFRTLTMFMSTKDKKNVSELIDYTRSSGVSSEIISSLKKNYQLN